MKIFGCNLGHVFLKTDNIDNCKIYNKIVF